MLCPICHSSEHRFFGKRLTFRYYRCVSCNHLFINPMPSETELRKLYSGNYEFNVDSTSLRRFKAKADEITLRLKRLHPSGKTLLDIGAGYGTFVEIATTYGLTAIGIEPTSNLYSSASTKLKNKILHTNFRNFSKTHRGKFDFISAIHVIEHVSNPKDFLTTALNLLDPRGVLYIETPNSDSHLAYFEKENYTFLTPPDHLNLFSKESLNILISNVGLDIQSSFFTYSFPEHLVGVLRGLKNGYSIDNSAEVSNTVSKQNRGVRSQNKLPFFDRVVAPLLTPLLNIGNRGSFLQVFIQKKN